MSNNWYIRRGEETKGPFSGQQVVQAIKAGDLKPNDLVCEVGGTEWVSVQSVEPFARVLPSPSPPPAHPATKTLPWARLLLGLLVISLLVVFAGVAVLLVLWKPWSTDAEAAGKGQTSPAGPTAVATHALVRGEEICREWVTEFAGGPGQEDLLSAQVEEEYSLARFMVSDGGELHVGQRCAEVISRVPAAYCHFENPWNTRDLPRGITARYLRNVMILYSSAPTDLQDMMEICVEADGRYERVQ